MVASEALVVFQVSTTVSPEVTAEGVAEICAVGVGAAGGAVAGAFATTLCLHPVTATEATNTAEISKNFFLFNELLLHGYARILSDAATLNIRGSPESKPRKASADHAPIIFHGQDQQRTNPAWPKGNLAANSGAPSLQFSPPGRILL